LGADERLQLGKIETRSTWGCVGVNWHFTGDADRGGSVVVEFRRKGTALWRPAMPLWRHEYKEVTMFSGSIFRLAPGTEYELRLSATDKSDAEAAPVVKTVAVRTLDYPRMPRRTIAVAAGGLVEAQELAKPGTVMLLAKGTYPGAVLKKPGKPGQWIVYKAAAPGQVIIEGRITVRADYVWLHGLTIRDPKNAIQGRNKGVCITACRISAHYGIHTGSGGENYFIADNVIHGDAAGKASFGGEGVDFGGGRGRCGHAVCFNEITDVADGVSYGYGNIDVYNNYIHEVVDDFIEPDYAHENYRIWNNRCYNAVCGFSFQPMRGGPWYMFGNLNVGAYLHAFKVKSIGGTAVICGNTVLTKSSQTNRVGSLLRGTTVNNVWLRASKGPLGYGGRPSPDLSPTRVDHNAYGTGGVAPFRVADYAKLAAIHGWDKHSVRVDHRQIFAGPVKLPAGEARHSRRGHGKLIPKDWWFEYTLLLPKAGSKLIDAGTVLPNVTGPYLGKAPDLGAHELGLGTAWYGPRTWDDGARLVYGMPKGWKKAPLARATDYAPIGCPDAKDAKVLLTCDSPTTFALMSVEQMTGEARWRRAREIVSAEGGAATKVLEFQDGFYARLYKSAGNARLVAARVEPDGVLRVVTGCRGVDLPRARLLMFQFVRSFYR
jgi:hypothetical protein